MNLATQHCRLRTYKGLGGAFEAKRTPTSASEEDWREDGFEFNFDLALRELAVRERISGGEAAAELEDAAVETQAIFREMSRCMLSGGQCGVVPLRAELPSVALRHFVLQPCGARRYVIRKVRGGRFAGEITACTAGANRFLNLELWDRVKDGCTDLVSVMNEVRGLRDDLLGAVQPLARSNVVPLGDVWTEMAGSVDRGDTA